MTKKGKMKKIIRALQHRWFLTALTCVIGFGAMSLTGCSGRSETSTVTTHTTSGVSGGSTSVTTDRGVVTEARPRGIIGGVFYTIGQVLIFPFRVIGSLFS